MAERLGFRGTINHYIGMSHYFALAAARAGGFEPDSECGGPGLAPRSRSSGSGAGTSSDLVDFLRNPRSILSRCVEAARVRRERRRLRAGTRHRHLSLRRIPMRSASLGESRRIWPGYRPKFGLEPMVQIGEPWWWVTPERRTLPLRRIRDGGARRDTRRDCRRSSADVGGASGTARRGRAHCSQVRRRSFPTASGPRSRARSILVLVYLPTVLDPATPELKRANLPLAWAKPAFDVLQLEDYEWVTAGRAARRIVAYAEVESGSATRRPNSITWPASSQAGASVNAGATSFRLPWTRRARRWRQCSCGRFRRSSATDLRYLEKSPVIAFDDVSFPIEIGAEASVAPAFFDKRGDERERQRVPQRQLAAGETTVRCRAGNPQRRRHRTLLAFFRARRGAAVGISIPRPVTTSARTA